MQQDQPPQPRVHEPAAAGPPDRRARRRYLGEWGLVLAMVLATFGVVAGIIIPMLGYVIFLKNKGTCTHKLASISTANKVLANTPEGPIGDKWCEGRALDPTTLEFTAKPADAIQKSRLALWRLIADPDKRKMNVSPGGPTVFHCPGATRGTKSTPPIGTLANPAPDFNDPINQLYYSMFLQKADGMNIPTLGTKATFIVIGDRSPASDGLPCISGQNSANHEWGDRQMGQNVLFSGGNVAFQERTDVGIDGDEIYLVDSTDGAPMGESVPKDNDDTVLMPVCDPARLP